MCDNPKSLPAFNPLQLRGLLSQTWSPGTEHPSLMWVHAILTQRHGNRSPSLYSKFGVYYLYLMSFSSCSGGNCERSIAIHSLHVTHCFTASGISFSIWWIPAYLILPLTGTVLITLMSLLPSSELCQFFYNLWNAGTRAGFSIRR